MVLFDEDGFPADGDFHEWCKPFIERDNICVVIKRDGFTVTPYRWPPPFYPGKVKERCKIDVQNAAAVATPYRFVQRV